tara:strand:- start:4637 stop:4822 length:186 start_codon:yes stop_codon:yes gene_type:complete
MDGDINVSLKMEFIEEDNARSEFNLYIDNEDLDSGIYLLISIQTGDTLAKHNTLDAQVEVS